MRILATIVALFASIAVTLAAPACKDDKDCVSLCEEAQGKDCTSISGDCGDFCSALDNVQDDADCTNQRTAYQDCLNEEGVCSGSCDDEETVLSTCLGLYCAALATDPSCMVLIESF